MIACLHQPPDFIRPFICTISNKFIFLRFLTNFFSYFLHFFVFFLKNASARTLNLRSLFPLTNDRNPLDTEGILCLHLYLIQVFFISEAFASLLFEILSFYSVIPARNRYLLYQKYFALQLYYIQLFSIFGIYTQLFMI